MTADQPEIDHLARVLMAAWERAEGKPVGVSYVATFADMARAVITDRARQDAEDLASREPCYEEIYSLDYFRNQGFDAYWIVCTKVGPHDEHEDSNTGAHWPAQAPSAPAGGAA